MNVNEAKTLLLVYRPGTADADDPQVAEALRLAKQDPELGLWLETQNLRHEGLRAKFKQIMPPAGLREQILSEHAASQRPMTVRRPVWAVLAALVLLGTLAAFWFPRGGHESALTFYQRQTVSWAERSYGMDMTTNNPAAIRVFLAQNQAPADFTLPAPLQHADLVGCAVEKWETANVAMICFRTGKPMPPGTASDLWLFVVDRKSVKNTPEAVAPQFVKISQLITATWTEGGKLYVLGVAGQEPDIRQYL